MIFKPIHGSQMSGSVGGNTWSHNKGGAYVRQRATPVNTPSAQRTAIRNAFASISAAWFNTLTPTQRTAWEAYAGANPVINRIGAVVTIGGNAMYLRINTPRLQAALPLVDVPPPNNGLGALDPVLTLVNNPTPPAAVDVAFNNADPWAVAVGGALLVYVSPPTNLSVNAWHGSYRLAGAVDGAVIPPTSPATLVAPFPFLAGRRLFWRVQASDNNGQPTAVLFGQLDT